MRPTRELTFDELEGVVWGPPTYPSHLVRTCHRLRTKPVGEFSTEDLRIMLGQQIGLPYLLPLALDRLEASPWATGDLLRISEEADHRFRSKPITRFARSRSRISLEADHRRPVMIA